MPPLALKAKPAALKAPALKREGQLGARLEKGGGKCCSTTVIGSSRRPFNTGMPRVSPPYDYDCRKAIG